jgi:hypothetical protein
VIVVQVTKTKVSTMAKNRFRGVNIKNAPLGEKRGK